MTMIKQDFDKIKTSDDSIKTMVEFNYDLFKEIVSSDELQIDNEKDVCDIILKYIILRRSIQPINDEKEKEKKQEVIEEEKKDGDQQNKEPEVIEEQKEEEKKQGDDVPKEEDVPAGEIQKEVQPEDEGAKVDLLQNWNNHLNDIDKKLEVIPLSKEQERELVECIRFSFLSHADLINLTTDPIISEHQDLLLEGLSVRLNSYESTAIKELKLNLTPRKCISLNKGISSDLMNNQQQHPEQFNENNQPKDQMYSSQMPQGNQIYSSMLSNNNKQMAMNTMIHQQQQQQPFSKTIQSQSDQVNVMYQSIPLAKDNQSQNNNLLLQNRYNDTNTGFYSSMPQQEYRETEEEKNEGKKNKKEKKDKNKDKDKDKEMKLYKSSNNPRPPQESMISIDFYKNMSVMNNPNPVFKYDYDFDENGVFYYLGSLGKFAPYKNPHEIAQVKVFASSIGKGSLSDLVGRESVNLRTLNEENSFFGVDLGQERFLVPSCYSIKNRNSSSHVLLCWHLEGSNDKTNFEILDTRIFSHSGNQKYHQSLEKERNMLKKPNSTSTWGISKKIKEKYSKGFRYFLIKQIDKNSSGGFNLALSGFELYGEGIGRNWVFN